MNETTANSATDSHHQPQPQPQPQPEPDPQYSQQEPRAMSQPLTRPVEDRLIAGVCAGFARYLNVDVTIVRIVLAVLTAIGGAGVPLYVAGWLLIPEEGHELSIAAGLIQGRPTRAL